MKLHKRGRECTAGIKLGSCLLTRKFSSYAAEHSLADLSCSCKKEITLWLAQRTILVSSLSHVSPFLGLFTGPGCLRSSAE